MKNTLLTNGTYIHPITHEFVKSHILIKPGKGNGIEFLDHLPDNNMDDVINCQGKYITSSFVCGHHHAYSALARGMGAPKVNPVNFNEILQYIWWTLDVCLDKEMVEYSALCTAMACVKNGVTCIIDHHASPNFIRESLFTIATAFEKIGADHLLCYEITDRGGDRRAQLGLEETASYLSVKQGLVGLHASFTVSDATLKSAVQLAEKHNSGIHIHVAEAESDQHHCQKVHNCRIVERLDRAGVLQFNKTILGHCLHLSEAEKEIIQNSPAWVVQNTESNLNNKVGYFNSDGLGNRIMLGTDGMHSDMIRSAQSAFFVGQGFDRIGYDTAYTRFRNADRYSKEFPGLNPGDNSLVVMDYQSPTAFDSQNFLGHFLFGWNSAQVQHVFAHGKPLVLNHKLCEVDEEEIIDKSRSLSRKLWAKMQTI